MSITKLPQPVIDFINERPYYVNSARNCSGEGTETGDYDRWQGHMEARRQLATALGYTVPYELGDKTRKQES